MAKTVGEAPSRQQAGDAAIVTATEGAAAGAGAESGDSGWIELETAVASVFYFSPEGEGESSWRHEPPRLFIRRLADGRVVVMLGDKDVEPPS